MIQLIDHIPEILKWIDSNERYDLKVEDVAGKAGWSKWHANRTFRRATGKSIGEYVFDRAMTEAARLLTVEGLHANQVTYLLDYNDPSSFHRAFCRKYGMTPRQFAKAAKK